MKRLLFLSLTSLLLLTAYAPVKGSIRINSSGEGVEYGNQSFDWDAGGVTIMAWVYVVNDRQADSALVSIRGAGILFIDSGRKLSIYVGNSVVHTNNTVFPIGEWHHVALVRDAAGPAVWRAYINGVADVVGPAVVDPTGDPHPYFGNDKYGSWLDGRVAAGKIWLAALTAAEIQAEMGSFAPVRTANIWSVVPMQVHTDLTDQSGQGHTPTAMGILSTEPDPPLTTTTSLSGRVTYADTVTPGKNVTMTLTAPSFPTQATTTGASGNYTFVGVPPGNDYTLTPSKTGDVNGLESLDASNVARYVTGLSVPSANQRIAADADGDGILTSLDASLIARYVVGLPGAGIVGTWKFVPSSRFYPALSGDQTSQNFAAILVGDTGGNWIPSLPSGNANSNSASLSVSRTTPASAPAAPSEQAGISPVATVTVFFPIVTKSRWARSLSPKPTQKENHVRID